MNGRNGALKIPKEKKQLYNSITTCDFTGIETVTLSKLIHKGFVVTFDTDEKKHAEYMWQQGTLNASMLRLIILPTEQCNFRCLYCYEDYNKPAMTDKVQTNIIKYVKRNIHNYASLRVSWFGGEPLLGIDVIENLSRELMDKCKKTKRAYVSDITTNGYYLTRDMMKKLLSFNVLSYQVTIDGVKSTHDRNRPLLSGDGTFDTITQNIQSIHDEIKSGIFEFSIRINYTKDTVSELQQLDIQLKNIIGNDRRFTFLFRPAGDWGGEIDDAIRCVFCNEDSASTLFDNILTNNLGFDISKHIDFLNPCGYVCYASCATAFVIDPLGNIRKCTCHLNSEANKVGLLQDTGMVFDKFRLDAWSVNLQDIPDKCVECLFFPVCGPGGCPANNVVLKKRRGENAICPLETQAIDKILLLYDKQNYFEVMPYDS